MKINLASGQRPFQKPWVNIDLIEQTDSEGKPYHMDIIADAGELPMIEDNSVDIIVAHHLFEHIAIHDHDKYITEWRRILKVGGILAIFVPNIREIDKAWLEGRIDTFIHNVNTYGAYQGHVEDLHKWAYDDKELCDRVSGWDGTSNKFSWDIEDINHSVLQRPIYSGHDCCLDWWILAKQFTKK
jgi:predicted SAM-dependent methyltransferase